jgi:predicted Rossmann fold nucleotide-binding protein DprA/Smf involved in DNA uptake
MDEVKQMLTHVLKPDTQAILLLCAHFGQFHDTEAQPLTLGEYNTLANWLKQEQMRPADLLDADIQKKLLEVPNLSADRLITLLKRGFTLGLTVEKWMSQGIWVMCRSDEDYPKKLKASLRHQAPAILYGVGNWSLLEGGGLAIVGSRNVDEDGTTYSRQIAQSCAESEMQVISGGARGVDQVSMLNALEAGGTVVGVMADSLARASVSSKYRNHITQKHLALISPYDPEAGFSVGNAMGRNKHIYALADYSLVVCSDLAKGGTWAGAIEALEKRPATPVFVRNVISLPGNQELLRRGAKSFPEPPWEMPITLLLAPHLVDSVSNNLENQSLVASELPEQITIDDQDKALLQNSFRTDPQSDSDSQSGLTVDDVPEIYEVVLSILCHFLQQPTDCKTLVEVLNSRSENVTENQVRNWLERAIAEGKIKKEKVKRKTVYSVVNSRTSKIEPLGNSDQLSILHQSLGN